MILEEDIPPNTIVTFAGSAGYGDTALLKEFFCLEFVESQDSVISSIWYRLLELPGFGL